MKNYKKNICTGVLTFIVLLIACSKDDSPEEVVLSSAKQLTSFTFTAANNTVFTQDIVASIDEETKTITAILASDIDLSSLIPSLVVF